LDDARHNQGQLLNATSIARGLGVSTPTVMTYLDLLVDLLLVRRLQPRLANVGKRQVRSPKTYVRDPGLLHALLGLGDKEALLGHPVLGASWEGFVIENLIALAPDRVEPSFYRTSGGAEIDLILRWPDGREWAIEVKRSLSPQPTRGMRSAIEDLEPERSFIVYPGKDRYRLGEQIEAISLPDLAADLLAR
jgi:predicted AAA+ superfamily ATPase